MQSRQWPLNYGSIVHNITIRLSVRHYFGMNYTSEELSRVAVYSTEVGARVYRWRHGETYKYTVVWPTGQTQWEVILKMDCIVVKLVIIFCIIGCSRQQADSGSSQFIGGKRSLSTMLNKYILQMQGIIMFTHIYIIYNVSMFHNLTYCLAY